MDNQNAQTHRAVDSLAITSPQRWLSCDRPDNTPISLWDGGVLTLGQLRGDVVALWLDLADAPGERWALCVGDGYTLLVALLALWHRGKTPVIPGHNREKQLEEQRGDFDGVISDTPLTIGCPLIMLKPTHQPATEILPAIADDARLIIFTSGSTGRPKAISKTLRTMATEARWLATLVRKTSRDKPIAGCRVVSSVTHQHMYGLSFGLFLPMTLGIPFARETSRYPEHLIRQSAQLPVLFISSPAFLTRLDQKLPAPDCIGVFSAGGPLPWQAAQQAGHWLCSCVTEIYGTTETGVLAWRRRRQETDAWQPFDGIDFHRSENHLRVSSALIDQPEGQYLDDRLEFTGQGQHFQLAGRHDQVINIEEKRVSLCEIEQRITAMAEVSEAAVVPITKHGRRCVGAVIVLTEQGTLGLHQGTLSTLTQLFRRRLSTWLEPVAVPRYWRVVLAMPRTGRGKYDSDRLNALFFNRLPLEISRLISAETQAELLLKVDPSLFWFRGHFPEQPILPGLAQVEWAMHYGREVLMTEGVFGGIENVKFQRPVKPGQTLRLQLEWQAQRRLLLFCYQLCDPQQREAPTISSGKIKLCP
ncbi:AMP-binding protein [Acerihabitans sp. TG2]|uniref:ApeI family dehydratase n=1 Tax=Acerihabitans sp. TG2 TaxID=3096008 RepID=UPI002B23B8F3|nr:AMP-binding protein [Acerihabitans sp. TG2]MEA9390031.1 AMP-binding protein [Acerihabitans sp. TG2]